MPHKLCIQLIFLLIIPFSLQAEPGIYKDTIRLGQTCSLSGPAQELCRAMKVGLTTFFAITNENGGIHGRRISLISKDDRSLYREGKRNISKLIKRLKVFLLVGSGDHSFSRKIYDEANRNKVPLFGFFSGSRLLHTPLKKNIINIRPGYHEEISTILKYLSLEKGIDRIACVYENSSFGRNRIKELRSIAPLYHSKIVGTAPLDNEQEVVTILRASPPAILAIGRTAPFIKFMRKAAQADGGNSIIAGLSTIHTDRLLQNVTPENGQTVLSHVVPSPWDKSIPVVREYVAALKKYWPREKISYHSFEGFLVAKMLVTALKQLENNVTRRRLIKYIEQTETFDLGGVVLRFSKNDHQGLDKVYLTTIKDGKLVSIIPKNYSLF